MSARGDLGRREYSFSWQSKFARAAKRAGDAVIAPARRSITMWRAMSRRAAKGQDPSEIDYRQIGHAPERFLLRRHKRKLDSAIRIGLTNKAMERRGLFDPLRHHQAYRAFKKAKALTQRRGRAGSHMRRP